MLSLVILINMLSTICESTLTLTTIPPTPTKELAAGYTGLVISVQVEKNRAQDCSWKYGETNNIRWTSLFFSCIDPSLPNGDKISCKLEQRNGMEYMSSNLTISNSITSNMSITAECTGVGQNNLFIIVKDCDAAPSLDLNVNSTSNKYNAKGEFVCSNNKILYSSSGKLLKKEQTTCSSTSKWTGQDNVQCWSAPNVSMTSNLTVYEGNNLTLSCNYHDVIPKGNYSIFYVNGVGRKIAKNKTLTLTSLQAGDNKKPVSCQADTPFTEIYNASGRSQVHIINVLYRPYQTGTSTRCHMILNQKGICKINFFSNPQSNFANLQTNNSKVETSNYGNNLITNGSAPDSQTYHFIKEKIAWSDNGSYTLFLSSHAFHGYSVITFDVIVFNAEDSSTMLIIGIAAGIALFILMILIIAWLILKKKNNLTENEVRTKSVNLRKLLREIGKENVSVKEPPPYVNTQNNVAVSREPNGYVTLKTLSPEEKKNPNHHYMNIPKANNTSVVTIPQGSQSPEEDTIVEYVNIQPKVK